MDATGSPPPDPVERRPPTAAEARALAHPLRLRILFACRDRARTNKELAELLGSTPGTIHYHLKPLVEEGFLRRERSRPGPRGSVEQPYRSTGKSWQVGGTPESGRVLRQVAASEVLELEDDPEFGLSRLGMALSESDLTELTERLHALVEEFAVRSRSHPEAPAGDRQDAVDVTLFYALYRSPGSEPPSS